MGMGGYMRDVRACIYIIMTGSAILRCRFGLGFTVSPAVFPAVIK